MPIPTRPVDGADIETDWGQEIHDRTFAPKGCDVAGAAVAMLSGGTIRTLPLDTAAQDPSGFLDAAGNLVEVPTDMEGLYLLSLRCNTVTGSSADKTRIFVNVNGGEVTRAIEDQSGGTNVPISVSAILDLVATDQIQVRAQQVGSGARADVNIVSLSLLRLGAEYG
jgi:hypothetical protein